jgi:hypothetical protein
MAPMKPANNAKKAKSMTERQGMIGADVTVRCGSFYRLNAA